MMKHSSILQHKCSVINRLLSTATDLFSDIESDLDESKDEDLIEQFHNLRDQTIQASHLLTLKGLEHPKLPKSVCGPDPNDVKSHLTRKTPLPLHPEPLILHALQHPLDLESAVSRAHPTPYMQPPPSSKDIKQEDFDINPEDYKTRSNKIKQDVLKFQASLHLVSCSIPKRSFLSQFLILWIQSRAILLQKRIQ